MKNITTEIQTLEVPSGQKVLEDLGVESVDDLKNELNLTIRRLGEGYLRLSQLLYYLKEHELFHAMGFNTWIDFCDDFLRMSRRRADYYVDIWSKIKGLPPPALKAFKKIPWTNARVIAGVINEHNYPKWVEAARTTPHDRLIEEVRQEKEKNILFLYGCRLVNQLK